MIEIDVNGKILYAEEKKKMKPRRIKAKAIIRTVQQQQQNVMLTFQVAGDSSGLLFCCCSCCWCLFNIHTCVNTRNAEMILHTNENPTNHLYPSIHIFNVDNIHTDVSVECIQLLTQQSTDKIRNNSKYIHI